MHSQDEAVGSTAARASDLVNYTVCFDECRDTATGLHFRSFLPDSSAIGPWARLILLHGYGDHGGRYGHVLNSLAARGISCYSLDFRGHGRSTGRRGYVRHWDEFLDNLDALLSWERSCNAQRTEQRRPVPKGCNTNAFPDPPPTDSVDAPLFVLGHSHGGLVAAAAGIAGRLQSVAGCILSSPFLRFRTQLSGPWRAFARLTSRVIPWMQVRSGLTADMMSSDPAMQAEAMADALLIHSATPRWYMETLRVQAQVLRDAGSFHLPLLCLAGDADPVADPEAAGQFVQDAGAVDKTLIRYPGKLHELLRESGREAIVETIFEWMRAR